MRYLRYSTFLAAAVFVASASDSPEVLIKTVKTIYVAPLEGSSQPFADMVYSKLISGVAKIPGVAVVEDEAHADAILIASGLMGTPIPTEYGHVRYRLQGGVRLISKKGEVVLWADDVSSSRFARSASSSFAENVSKSLEQVFADRPKK